VPLSDFLLDVFCLVDDLYRQLVRRPLRSRGPRATALTDPEVIAIELVGEFLGLDHDKGLFAHFRRHYRPEFPGLMRVCRTTFARQAANLYAVKHALHKHLAARLADGEPVWLVDSLPVEACRFARAKSCRRLKGDAAFGYDHTARNTMYGFRLHARCTPAGAIVAFDLAPANVSDVAMVDQLRPPPGSVGAAGPGAAGHRDGVRPARRAVPHQADVGAGPVAPQPPGHPEDPRTHRRRLDQPLTRPPTVGLRWLGGVRNPHTALNTSRQQRK
jgi:hypothetical protein